VHVHGEVAAGLCLPSLAARPSVATLHGLHLLRRVSGARAVAARTNLRLLVEAANRTICVSHAEHDDVRAIVGRRAAAKLVVIHNGVPTQEPVTAVEREAARSELEIADGSIVAVYVGSLVAHKDPVAIARAAVDVARTGVPIVLLVVGDGPLRPELQQLAAASGGSVRILGCRPDPKPVLAAADLFVLPSRREGLSYALLEAMALGLPAVVTDAPGNPEAVGDAGIVVASGDVQGFASAILSLSSDPAARVELGERARHRVSTAFRVDEMCERTARLYDEAIASRSRRRRVAAGSSPSNRS
jgi:glycosyltransferase involved in cell wall biosynthesis